MVMLARSLHAIFFRLQFPSQFRRWFSHGRSCSCRLRPLEPCAEDEQSRCKHRSLVLPSGLCIATLSLAASGVGFSLSVHVGITPCISIFYRPRQGILEHQAFKWPLGSPSVLFQCAAPRSVPRESILRTPTVLVSTGRKGKSHWISTSFVV
jgi:hypothetical protein